ncbi:hypothetical protein ACVDG5_000085 [Mesorhizobium sp. ORM6]
MGREIQPPVNENSFSGRSVKPAGALAGRHPLAPTVSAADSGGHPLIGGLTPPSLKAARNLRKTDSAGWRSSIVVTLRGGFKTTKSAVKNREVVEDHDIEHFARQNGVTTEQVKSATLPDCAVSRGIVERTQAPANIHDFPFSSVTTA